MGQEEIRALSAARHAEGSCPGFMDITDYQAPLKVGPVIVPFEAFAGPTQGQTVEPLLAEISADRIHATIQDLSSFSTRHYSTDLGLKAATLIRDRFVEYAGHRDDITVTFFNHSWKQPSVIARIPGRGPHASEIVVIGGHEDSINHQSWNSDPDAKAPGADDNASGTATVLEIFRVLAQSDYRPDRTLEFMTYAAEEVGLWGSQAISRQYRQQNAQVVGVMQFDMDMFPNEQQQMTFITDNVSPDLTKFTEQLVDTYVKSPWTEDKCGYGCSDHASWTKAGYASVMPFEAPMEEMNHNLHTPQDTLDILNQTHGAKFARLGVAFAVELGTIQP
jgi:leucyl aminopeptidase